MDGLRIFFELRILVHNEKHYRGPPPETFPIANCFDEAVQIVSLLQPIYVTNTKSQGNNANMVHVLLSLYKIQKNAINLDVGILDYRSKKDDLVYIPTIELTSMVKYTRKRLKDAFFESFFCRYTKRREIMKQSFLPEMCMYFDPMLKNMKALEQAARTCNLELKVEEPLLSQTVRAVMDRVENNVKKLLLKAARSLNNQSEVNVEQESIYQVNAEIKETYEEYGDMFQQAQTRRNEEVVLEKVEAEMDRWKHDFGNTWQFKSDTKKCETILEFWNRQQSKYPIMYRVSLVLLAIPPSAAEIERDFGIAGNLVTKNRTSIKGEYIDMSLFCNCNRGLILIDQVPELSQEQRKQFMPRNITMEFDGSDDFFDCDAAMSNFFTSSTIE